jgi:excisionase family DNA binding protein
LLLLTIDIWMACRSKEVFCKMKVDSSRVMTVKELSDYLKVHPSTVYRQLKRGQLPAFKVGSDWRFNVESIDRWRLEQDSFTNNGHQ